MKRYRVTAHGPQNVAPSGAVFETDKTLSPYLAACAAVHAWGGLPTHVRHDHAGCFRYACGASVISKITVTEVP